MFKKFIYFFLLILICFKNKAQFLDKKIYLVDSLQKKESNKNDFILIENNLKLYRQATADTARLSILNLIIEGCNDENIWPRYNRLMYSMANELYLKEKDPELKKRYLTEKGLALNNYGFYIQNYTKNPERSLALYREAAKALTESDHKIGLVVTNNNIANLLYNNGKISDAIDIYHATIKIQEELKNNTGLTPLLNNLGEVYLFLGDSTKAYFYIQRALSSAIQSGDKRIIAQEFQNIGILARNRHQKEYALSCLKKALSIREEIGDVNGICKSKLNLAVTYMTDNNYVLAKQYLNDVEPEVAKTDNLQVKQSYHFSLAQYYASLNEPLKSIKEFEASLEYSRQGNSIQEEAKTVSILVKMYKDQHMDAKELGAYRRLNEISKQTNSSEVRRNALKKDYEYEFSKKENEIKIEQAIKDEKTKDEKRKQKFITLGISFILLLTLIFSFFILKAFRSSKQKNIIISNQKMEVEKQKHLIEEKQKEIVDSINYAKRIQNTLLANEELLSKNLPNHFIFFKPKDIVSGDFYWANSVVNEEVNLFFLAVCDSTGHGVPGAFMSLLNTNFLNEAINEKHIYEPNRVFNYVRDRLINSISKEEQKDGFDGILICIDRSKNRITYTAANNAPILVKQNKELIKLPFDKMPVGKGEKPADFNLHTIDHNQYDIIYLYTDGYADQFGGPGVDPSKGFLAGGGKKFKYKPLNDLLVSINNVPLNEQSQILEQKFMDWKGGLEQVDDVCIVGIRL